MFKLENSVLIGPHDQDRKDLAAIDPASFERVAALSDSFFVDRSAAAAMAALGADPRGLLVDSQTADELSVETGDRVSVLLARGTKRQSARGVPTSSVCSTASPGFPRARTSSRTSPTTRRRRACGGADFFLARTTGRQRTTASRARSRRSAPGPAARDPINIETTETALDKDQSSLTALNVQGLVDLDSLFTLLMSAAGIAIFVFGLMLQRRREYVTLLRAGHAGPRASGARAR